MVWKKCIRTLELYKKFSHTMTFFCSYEKAKIHVNNPYVNNIRSLLEIKIFKKLNFEDIGLSSVLFFMDSKRHLKVVENR